MALTPLATEIDPLPTPSRPSTFEEDMDRFINTKLPLLAEEVDGVATAFTQNATNSTSSTSIAIGVGTKNYTVEASKSYVKGMFVLAADTAAPSTNYNYGQVLSYDDGTGVLSIDVSDSAGSGTKTAWAISLAPIGGVSTAGATFTGDVIVPAEVYGVGWNGDNATPTKNDVYDEIVKIPTETTIGRVEKATAVEAAAFTADKYLDGARLKDAFNATGTAPFYACRAHGNFNGADGATRNAGNLSCSRTSVGLYAFSFSTNMPDASYTLLATTSDATADAANWTTPQPRDLTVSGFNLDCETDTGAQVDPDLLMIAVFR